jgi:hypothetical protein
MKGVKGLIGGIAAVAAVAGAAAFAGHGAAAPATVNPHPRIWLDPGTLATLRTRASSGTAQWQALKHDCDTFMLGAIQYPDGIDYPDQGIGEGYQGSGYYEAVLDLGLCAQTAPSGRATYAARVAAVLNHMSNPTHEPNPLRDDGYGIRNYGVAMAVGYDWAYSALSSAVKQQVITALHSWIGAFESGGFERDFPQGNYFAGYFAAKALAALATEGDDSQAAAQWQSWLSLFSTFVKPYYAANLAGGGWPEGWEYGPLATLNMTLPIDAARTAKGLDLVSSFPYAIKAPRFVVNFTWPNLRSMEDAGVQHDNDNPSGTDPEFAFAEAGLLARFGDDFAATMHSYAQQILQVDGDQRPSLGHWVQFLFGAPFPRSGVQALPLSYFAKGMGYAEMRSSTSQSAVFATVKGAPYVGNPDAAEEFPDEGQVTIVEGGKQFLVYAPSALMRNTPGTTDGTPYENLIYSDLFDDAGARDLFNVFMTSAPTPTGQNEALRVDGAVTSTTFADHGTYTLAQIRHLADMYPRNPGTTATITTWQRDVVYIRPQIFVVHDLTTVTSPPPGQWFGWSFLGRPTAVGDGRYQVSAGTIQPVLPPTRTSSIVNVFGGGKVYRLEVHAADAKTTHNWLTVLWAGSGSVAAHAVPVTGGVGVSVAGHTVTFVGSTVTVS